MVSPLFIESTPEQRTGTTPDSVYKSKVVSILDGARPQTAIPINALYPDLDGATGVLRSALRLTESALALVEESAALRWSDPVGSDDRMNRLVPVLLELFCWRELGEGFAVVVNGLLCGVKNQVADTWNGPQLKAVHDVIYALRSEPYLDFDKAIRHVEQLEASGLTPEPRELEILADWLDAQSVG